MKNVLMLNSVAREIEAFLAIIDHLIVINKNGSFRKKY